MPSPRALAQSFRAARLPQPHCSFFSRTSRCATPTAPRLHSLRCSYHATRPLRASSSKPNPPQRATTPKPTTVDRGPPSEEDTQTDFSALDVLSGAPPPATAIDACTDDGFVLNNGAALSRCGLLLVGGEAFRWWPWRAEWADNKAGGGGANEKRRARVRNEKGQWQVGDGAWGVLDLVWPKPDLLIIGTGKSISPLSPRTRDYINSLGIRIEVQDTQNAAAQFNMLATERGVQQIAAALVPIGFKDV